MPTASVMASAIVADSVRKPPKSASATSNQIVANWTSGENALSVGYSKPIGDRASFSIGGAFSGDEKSAGVGFGIDL